KPNEVSEVLKTGIFNWLQQQLTGNLPEDALEEKLKSYDALKMSNAQILATFPRPGKLLKMAEEDGYLKRKDIDNEQERRRLLASYLQSKGLRPQQELLRQFVNGKILRATYASNQLKEVMTDFWFNHFNISATKNEAAPYIPNYERDVIRPNALSNFPSLLLATAKSPAMLTYLDNFLSAGENQQINQKIAGNSGFFLQKNGSQQEREALRKMQRNKGLNENYAREIMELHTLGVDGGYTQKDVTEAARVLTGWTIFPTKDEPAGKQINTVFNRFSEEQLNKWGFVREGDFLFAANRHDDGPKQVMNLQFDAGGGINEGITLINYLANHQNTAQFICKKIAVRFVSDSPSVQLVTTLAQTFTQTKGNVTAVLWKLVEQKEFWQSFRQKTKSPFELIISSLRALNASINAPFPLYNWSTKMGQKIYNYQAPTGFPDQGQYWINTGALLNRMNFGITISANKIPGVTANLAAINNYHEPESNEEALKTYFNLLLPERNNQKAIQQLLPLIAKENFSEAIHKAANEKKKNNNNEEMDDFASVENTPTKTMGHEGITTQQLAQIVGIIIGSPEFQRR
ncbi:MAG: DUF1800 domain-containing protein, partial [Chitinophagaceae bacterium]